ncbi:MAG: peptidoglycan DD-metalloendopeptidase family protein [Micavibrio aeruginosavorus]|uniref:Peptidoglycan DD-metalloendopeptidase family protein n=1 Tax=Micavibrio aeruginosavorus TaxID=349221 RepID=A0A7T5UG29_9BACT|nr:MAG: peptidoglycan DD-metalloendopeptidase family protein [Micavibrio aeruginosavorus]
MRAVICLLALLFLCWPTPFSTTVAASEIKGSQKSLEEIKSLLATEQKKKDDLAQEQKEAEKQVKSTKSEIARLTANIRKNESSLKALEERMAMLETERTQLSQRMEKDHGAIARTVLALERLRRMPPELMIVKPGAPLETAQTAMLLKRVLPALQHRADLLGRDLESLKLIQEQLEADKKEVSATRSQLAEQKAKLDKLAAEREKAFKAANKAYKSSAARAERLAAEAASLGELMKKLDEDNRQKTFDRNEESRTKQAKSVPSSPHKKSGALAKGGIWPVNGKILSRFGERDEMGAETQGLKIASSPGSIVVTPFEGTVKYAGIFRNYGQLVIVEHNSGYHSLLAGMTRANVGIGQDLKAGDPVGYMPTSSSQDTPSTLYYELRYNSEPIDPSYLFADIKT